MKKDSKIPGDDQCPGGTRVCGVETDYNHADNTETVRKVIPIAGDYTTSHGRHLDPQWTRLKGSASNEDTDKEGLRLELNGGKYPLNSRRGREQKAIVEFSCNKTMEGTEGFEETSSITAMLRRRDDDDEDDDEPLPEMDEGKALQFLSYKCVGDDCDQEGKGTDTLRLIWKTKYACEGKADDAPDAPADDGGKKSSASWGFFTWFIIVLFLLAAAYIIFGSWLNYNRYGARGWDLIPHGDTIRDMPYIVKDWAGNVVGAVKGGGSRGGYSAV